jgi:FKBP-type peptidyl-prolyl cis-trans isomerase FklB
MRILCIAVLTVAFFAGQAVAAEKVTIKSEKGKRSYSIGYNIGTNLKQESFDIDPDLVAKGLREALSGKKAAMTEQEIRETLTAFQQEIMAKRNAKMKEIADKNKAEGDAFLAANKTKPGITVLPSGLQYKIITEGKGDSPKPTSKIKAHYRGTLIDGTEFDSSYKRGTPADFDLDKIIAGWREALPLMKEGAKWQIFVPSNLAYGDRGQGPVIGPNSVLIFEIELISIVK